MTLLDLATLGLRALFEFTRDDDAFDDLIERLDAVEGDEGEVS
nr:hypothetical protein [Sphingomonas populi]